MIGVFDSGLGGLCALKALRTRFPFTDFVYLADTARLPYGAHSPEAILRYAREALSFFLHKGADAILFACGTVSALALPTLKENTEYPLYGIITPSVKEAKRLWQSGSILVLGTEATVKSRAFAAALESILPQARLFSIACPLFVSLAEEGLTEEGNPIADAAVRYYLSTLQGERLDAILLGCTHFSYLAPFIRPIFPDTPILDCGSLAAGALPLSLGKTEGGKTEFFVTENAPAFSQKASRLLKERAEAKQVSLSSFA